MRHVHANIDMYEQLIYNSSMYIPRYLDLNHELEPGKTLVLFGPRRVGKTTLLNNFVKATGKETVLYRGDELTTQHAFGVPDQAALQPYVGSAQVLILDEAQAIPGIGQSLKIINDTMPHVAVIATGSSSFELAGQVGEPLTGRKTTRFLYPIALTELLAGQTAPVTAFKRRLPGYLVYGMYPNALTAANDQARAEFLREIVDSYLLRDILAYQEVKGSRVLLQLLVLLAYQVGSEVSMSELGSALGIDKNTVARYLDLLEKSYIIFRLGGFSRNLRSEITKTAKYYFYDVGVRNAVINNFNQLSLRDDVGRLWENFMIVERLKMRTYTKMYANQYFWRTWEQHEIDLIEERGGKLFAYEFKWKDKTQAPSAQWQDAYGDNSEWLTVSPANALRFLGVK